LSASYDVFIDLSQPPCGEAALRDHLDRLADDAGLVGIAGRFTVSAPAPAGADCALAVEVVADRPAIAVLARAIRMAARARRHLVVLLGAVAPGSEVIAQLIAGFAQDPMLGTAQPRFAEPTTDRIWPLPGDALDADALGAVVPSTARAMLLQLPPDVITPELPACCLVLRFELLIGVEPADQEGMSLPGGLLHLVAQARRLGFRNLVRNRVVVATSLPYPDIYPSAPAAEIDRLRGIDPYAAGTQREIAGLSQRRAEALLAAAAPDANGRLRLLLDCRGMPALHNGTATCVLGLLDGFAGLDAGWCIDVLAAASARDFHGLAERYPGFRHLSAAPDGHYAAAVLLSQPWAIGAVAELHAHALLTAFLMLDAIAWDIFPGRTGMEATWRFIARHADGLLYISHFTRARFNQRFPVAPEVAETVTHLSLAQDDYLDDGCAPASASAAIAAPDPPAPQILVFGNGFEHKHVRPTAQLLADAFPFHRIAALGIADAPGPNVTAVPSGQMPRSALLALIDGAGVIVFPSFYEGFGLPVVEGLARGRTVLVRRSELWAEIAAYSRLPGRLCWFDDPASLVDGVGRALAGLPLAALPSGMALDEGTAPAGWKDCAKRILDLHDGRLARPGLAHWWAREQALRLLRP
jgi:hypothetical protein